MNNFLSKTFITKSSKETKQLGKNFAKTLKSGDVICLYGNLGGGKTTFTQGLSEGLGIKEKIISPTFIIIRSYPDNNFYHVDLYRVDSEQNLINLGLEEILNDSSSIVVVEWAEKLKSFMPKKRIDVRFSLEGENSRKITFSLAH